MEFLAWSWTQQEQWKIHKPRSKKILQARWKKGPPVRSRSHIPKSMRYPEHWKTELERWKNLDPKLTIHQARSKKALGRWKSRIPMLKIPRGHWKKEPVHWKMELGCWRSRIPTLTIHQEWLTKQPGS